MLEQSSDTPPIVVRLPNWVGDVCMSLCSLRAVTATNRTVIVCAKPWAQELLGSLTPVVFVPISGQFLRDLRTLRQTLLPHRGQGNPLGLIFPDSFSSAALFRLAGIRSVGYRDDGRSLMLAHAVAKPTVRPHAVLKWWALTRQALAHWGLDQAAYVANQPPAVQFEPSPSDAAQAQAQLESRGLTDKPFILLAPTATGRHQGKIKTWPGFHELSNNLFAAGITTVTCPPAHERTQAQAATSHAALLDPLPLGAFAALAKRAALVVCNDSGVSHLAALTGARQLTLFGVTEPATTGPWSATAQVAGELGRWPTVDSVTRLCLDAMNHTGSEQD